MAEISQEASKLASLNHEHLIKYFDLFQDTECVYIITEYFQVILLE